MKAAKSVISKVLRSVVTTGRRGMAVGGGAAVAGQMLEDRQHAAACSPAATAAAMAATWCGGRPIGAVPDHLVGARDRHVGERQAIDRDPDAPRDRPRSAGRPSRAARRPSAGSRW